MIGDDLRAREASILVDPIEDGAALLEEVAAFIRRFVVMSTEQADFLALWAMHTHAVDAAYATPYAHIRSPEKECGKSTAIDVLALVAYRPLRTANITPAALFRTLDEKGGSCLLDEADTMFASKGRPSERAEELRGLLNAGFRRGTPATRMVGQGAAMQPKDFDVFGPKAIAGIGNLPDTISSRAVPVRLKKKHRGEHVERFRERRVRPEGDSLRARLAAWAAAHVDELAAADPALPDELSDRGQDIWEPLFAVADRAGGSWPERARRAALALSARRSDDDESYGVRLLTDIYAAFVGESVERMSSADLCSALNILEEAPWGGWSDGKGINPRELAKRLRAFDIKSGTVRLPDGTQAKGYKREQFTDAWARYCRDGDPPEDAPDDPPEDAREGPDPVKVASQPSQRHNPHGDWDSGGTDASVGEPIRTAENPHGDWDVPVGRTDGDFHGNGGPPPTPEQAQELLEDVFGPVELVDEGQS